MDRLCHPSASRSSPELQAHILGVGLPSPPHQDSSTHDQHSERHEPVSAALSTVHVFWNLHF